LFENNTDLQLNYNKTFGKFIFTGLLGANSRSFTYDSFYGTTRALAIPNVYGLSNSLQPALTYNWNSKMQVYSGYYSFDIAYDKYLNINTTGRVDKLSTFASGHDTFFYPSVSLSTAVSDYVDLPEAISFLKFRASEAVLKSGLTMSTIGTAYKQVTNTGATTNTLLGYGTELYSSYDGPTYSNQDLASYTTLYNNSASVGYSNTKANPELKSLKRISYEAGMDIKFLQNRLGLDVTYFDTQNGPQIYPFPVDPATGFTAQNENAVTTKRAGWEVALTGSPFRNKDGFSWDINLNYSTFKETLSSIGYGTNSTIALVPNHSFAVGDRVDEVYGTKFLRDGSGNIVYDASGALLKASGSNSQLYGALGHLNPDFTFGINNRFSYKNFSFSFQVDGRIGGVIYDYNYYAARQGGTDLSTVNGVIGAARLAEWQSTKTGTQAPAPSLLGNESGAGVTITSGTPKYQNGVISNLSDLTFAPNTKAITVQGYLNGNVKSIDESFMISRSFAKLREVTLGYNVPSKYLKNRAIKAVSISLVGRNLLYFAARKDFDIDQYASGFDSTTGTTGGAQANGALQSTTARRYGFNLNVTF
jgi:hypothetical protein